MYFLIPCGGLIAEGQEGAFESHPLSLIILRRLKLIQLNKLLRLLPYHVDFEDKKITVLMIRSMKCRYASLRLGTGWFILITGRIIKAKMN